MSPFGRKKKDEVEAVPEPVETPAAGADEPDPAAWALPADAGAVTTDAGTAATDAAAAETVEEPATVAEPDPEPVVEPDPIGPAVPVDPTPAREPAASSSWTPPSGDGGSDPLATATEKYAEVSQQRPEVLVGAAFAGAFVFARILKRITNG